MVENDSFSVNTIKKKKQQQDDYSGSATPMWKIKSIPQIISLLGHK